MLNVLENESEDKCPKGRKRWPVQVFKRKGTSLQRNSLLRCSRECCFYSRDRGAHILGEETGRMDMGSWPLLSQMCLVSWRNHHMSFTNIPSHGMWQTKSTLWKELSLHRLRSVPALWQPRPRPQEVHGSLARSGWIPKHFDVAQAGLAVSSVCGGSGEYRVFPFCVADVKATPGAVLADLSGPVGMS